MGYREHEVKVPHGEEFGVLFLNPPSVGQGLALGTVPVSARVVGGALESTGIAFFQVTAQSRCTTEMGNRQRMRAAKGLSVVPEDVPKLDAASFGCRPLTGSQHRSSPYSWSWSRGLTTESTFFGRSFR
jgi:hypothetical protein